MAAWRGCTWFSALEQRSVHQRSQVLVVTDHKDSDLCYTTKATGRLIGRPIMQSLGSTHGSISGPSYFVLIPHEATFTIPVLLICYDIDGCPFRSEEERSGCSYV